VTIKWNKILHNFLKKVAKKAKIFTSELNLKGKTICIKPLLKPQNIDNKPCIGTACVFENLSCKKYPKVAEMSIFHPICGLYYKTIMIVIRQS
jgi:hypothetical protein